MIVPVIRGRIGNWRYYTGLMSFGQVREYVTASIGELHQAQCLDELLQRALTSNYTAIKEYILRDDERFFNALILAIYDGDPQWLEVEFDGEDFTNVGFLKFSGEETIFPVDGQHRVAGIKAALEEDEELISETIPVVFIAHSQSETGRTRTRKLFSTLNRRAKPVGQNENIALDEDDVCSILTRKLLTEYELFSGDNVVNAKGKQISSSNEKAFTSLIALYQSVCIIVQKELGLTDKKFKAYQLYRPSEETILRLSDKVHNVFDSFVNNTGVIQKYLGETSQNKAAAFRNKDGGNILFRPIILTNYIYVAITISTNENISIENAFVRLNRIPQNLNEKPWKGLLWDGEKIINRLSHTTIRQLLIFMTGSDILKQKEYSGLVNAFARSLSMEAIEVEDFLKEYRDIGLR